MTPDEIKAARAIWAEWDAASAATESAYAAWQRSKATYRLRNDWQTRRTMNDLEREWHATCDRTDKARKAVAGLPDPGELDAFERDNQGAAEAAARQGELF